MNNDDYRRDFASYNSALELAHYKYRAGFETGLHIEPLFDRYGHLFTRETINALRQLLEETPAFLQTERDGLRALAGAACLGYLESSGRELTDERARCETTVRVTWDGSEVPLQSVAKLLSNESDVGRRRELAARWSDALSSCDDLRAARLEALHTAARTLGFDSYRALYTDIAGTDYERLARTTDDFLERTAPAYRSALAQGIARDLPGVALDELEYSDYFFFQRLPRLDSFFPQSDALSTYAAAMNALGIRVEQQHNIHIDAEARPFKHPRAACFRINPPDDIRLLVAPVGGPYDYMTLFHEAGHAQHFGWASRELCERHPEFIYAPENATAEGYAFLLNHLFHDPLWLMEHRPGLDEAKARDIVRSLALLTTSNVRRRAASLRYEIALHDSPRVRSEQLAQTYATLVGEATLFRRNPALYLVDVDDGFYSAAYLRAWAFEAGLREHLRLRYGHRWWASRKAADDLIDLWNTASRYTVEELARHIGFDEISFDLLADTLIAALKED